MTVLNNIKGKNILLICDNFMNYDIAVRDELKKLGANKVILYGIKRFKSSFREGLGFLTPFLYLLDPNARKKWTRQLENAIEKTRIDFLFCIENTPFHKSFFSFLKNTNPEVKCILFLWDTLKTQQNGFKDYFPNFDKIYSFDRDDCVKYGFVYKPDFYIDNTRQTDNDNIVYDISFVGSTLPKVTSERIEQISLIKKYCDSHNLKSFFHLRYLDLGKEKGFLGICKRIWYRKYMKLVEKHKKEGFLSDIKLTLSEVEHIQHISKAILDLNHKGRQGMTINCITALAFGKKLITTNGRIANEPFYDEKAISILPPSNYIIDIPFIKTEYIPLDISHLRLDNWLLDIFSKI